VLGSNIGRDIGYAFPWVFSILPGKYQDSISIRLRRLPSESFPINYSLIILPFDAVYSRYWQRRIIICKREGITVEENGLRRQVKRRTQRRRRRGRMRK
jgi:hypothetical protein